MPLTLKTSSFESFGVGGTTAVDDTDDVLLRFLLSPTIFERFKLIQSLLMQNSSFVCQWLRCTRVRKMTHATVRHIPRYNATCNIFTATVAFNVENAVSNRYFLNMFNIVIFISHNYYFYIFR